MQFECVCCTDTIAREWEKRNVGGTSEEVACVVNVLSDAGLRRSLIIIICS